VNSCEFVNPKIHRGLQARVFDQSSRPAGRAVVRRGSPSGHIRTPLPNSAGGLLPAHLPVTRPVGGISPGVAHDRELSTSSGLAEGQRESNMNVQVRTQLPTDKCNSINVSADSAVTRFKVINKINHAPDTFGAPSGGAGLPRASLDA
jgi:hypothetical protein